MPNPKKDNEFQRLIRTIYGNSELDRRTKKLLEYTWKTNPDIIRLTAKQKANITSLNKLELPKIQLKTVSDIALSLSTSIRDIVPQRRSDDFSGMSFSEAFRRARQSGLNTFRWNSGIYGTELAKELKSELKSESEDITTELPEVTIMSTDNIAIPTDSIRPVLSDSIAIPQDLQDLYEKILLRLRKYEYFLFLMLKTGTRTQEELVKAIARMRDEDFNKLKKEFISILDQRDQRYESQQRSMITKGPGFWRRNFPNFAEVFDYLKVHNPIFRLFLPWFKQGGKVENKDKQQTVQRKQQGGQLTMNEQQLLQAFIQYLAQKTGAKTQQELEAVIQLLGEEGLRLAYAEFIQMIQLQQVQAAKFGAKLNYIKSLRGQCPEGYEISYYKVGGTLCKKCMKKLQEMKDGGQVPKDPINEFKCGRKMKKKAQGGGVNLNNGKCKKKESGGEINSTTNPATFSKMTLAKCGTKLKEACKGVKFSCTGSKIKSKATGGAVSGKLLCKKKASGGTVSTPNGTYTDSKGTKWKPGKKYNPKG